MTQWWIRFLFWKVPNKAHKGCSFEEQHGVLELDGDYYLILPSCCSCTLIVACLWGLVYETYDDDGQIGHRQTHSTNTHDTSRCFFVLWSVLLAGRTDIVRHELVSPSSILSPTTLTAVMSPAKFLISDFWPVFRISKYYDSSKTDFEFTMAFRNPYLKYFGTIEFSMILYCISKNGFEFCRGGNVAYSGVHVLYFKISTCF
jgi:hypothetical protein